MTNIMCLPFVNSADELIVAAEENTGNKAQCQLLYIAEPHECSGERKDYGCGKRNIVFFSPDFLFLFELSMNIMSEIGLFLWM